MAPTTTSAVGNSASPPAGLAKRGRRRQTRQPARPGFTLLEFLLVLALLVAIGAVCWPTIHRAFESVRLKKGGEQIMAAFGNARVKAMTTGLAHVFQFEPETGHFQVSAWQEESLVTGAGGLAQAARAPQPATPSNAMQPIGNSLAATPGAPTGQAAVPSTKTLPDGLAFRATEQALSARDAANLSGDQSAGAAAPIFFYPDGTTSDAVVTIGNDYGRVVSVSLRGLTGVARLGEVTFEQGPGASGDSGYQMPTYPNARNPAGMR